MLSESTLPSTPTNLAQQNSASANVSIEENNVLNTVFGILATLTALLSLVVAYQQLVIMRQSRNFKEQSVELDATISHGSLPVAPNEGDIEYAYNSNITWRMAAELES
ncbi:hypothetical protein VSDG_00551 [Cytospora chrysosperma]|uniref:Uncharacterized protein n=1 Tax=Cytospora chrysosperma TaxID=252740 RepID=A0A423WQE8_CYTCH|nr:hypothetical protein VSDG_00551 [Valsa sordida]